MLFLAGRGHWQLAAGLPVYRYLNFFKAQGTMQQGIISSANATPPQKKTKKERKKNSHLKVYKNTELCRSEPGA